jgi:hypothetical protein
MTSAVQTIRAAAIYHLRTSLHDLSQIPSTATQSIRNLFRQLLPHYLTYAMAVGGSAISFAPWQLYGGKSGGRGFRGPFLSFSSSFACGGGGVNEGRACFSFGVGRMKCDDTHCWKVFLRHAAITHTPLVSLKTESLRHEPSQFTVRRPRTVQPYLVTRVVASGKIRLQALFLIVCVHPSQGKESRHLS